VLQLIDAASIAEDEVFVDLGSGLGHVPLLVSLLTGARSVGVEIEAAYVASARACAESLRCSRVSFLEQDVREADLSRGTIVYLYTPFSGSMLADVLGALQGESRRRAFKVCTLGPCTRSVANEAWLRARTPPDAGHITVFDTR
jgi:tRNA1(Val) A37 N6-methylase TrmN6